MQGNIKVPKADSVGTELSIHAGLNNDDGAKAIVGSKIPGATGADQIFFDIAGIHAVIEALLDAVFVVKPGISGLARRHLGLTGEWQNQKQNCESEESLKHQPG